MRERGGGRLRGSLASSGRRRGVFETRNPRRAQVVGEGPPQPPAGAAAVGSRRGIGAAVRFPRGATTQCQLWETWMGIPRRRLGRPPIRAVRRRCAACRRRRGIPIHVSPRVSRGAHARPPTGRDELRLSSRKPVARNGAGPTSPVRGQFPESRGRLRLQVRGIASARPAEARVVPTSRAHYLKNQESDP